jgi:protein AroM
MTDTKRNPDLPAYSIKKRIGFLTIGQSPRDDFMSEIKPLLSPNIEPVEYGILDGLRTEEIVGLSPGPGETPLISRQRDGKQVRLGEKKIGELLPEAIETMKTKMGVEAVGLLCTHEFPSKKYPCPVIFPVAYMRCIADEILEGQKLGIVVPSEEQIEMTKRKWGGEKTSVACKSPYEKGKSWDYIADALAEENIDAIILDCIGFSIQDRQEIQSLLNIPVLLPRIILVFALNQIF